MAVELQIRSKTFALLVARALQRSLMTTCFAPSDGIYVDHVDPVPEQAQWSSEAGVATVRLPLDVFLVRRDELLAAADQIPAGATRAAGRVGLVIQVAIEEAALVVTVKDVDLGAAAGMLGGLADDVRRTILAGASTGPRIEVGALLHNLGLDTAAPEGAVVFTGDLIVARFGTLTGPPAPVAHGFEWAFFLDAASVEGLLEARIPSSMPPLQSVTTRAQWAPVGGTPFIRASVKGPVKVPDPFKCRVDVRLDCTLSMPSPALKLRIDTEYYISIDTGLPFLDDAIDDEIQQVVNPAAFGGVRTGERSFAIELELPQIGEAWYDGLAADAAGLVLGGSMALPADLTQVVLRTTVGRFSGGNHASLFCSRGDPQTDVPLAKFFSTVARVGYEGGGSLCDVEVIPGGVGFEKHLTLPKPAMFAKGRPGDGSIWLGFGVEDANKVTEDIRLIITSPRGVRCCYLGRPEHFIIKEDGTIEGASVLWTDDCDKLPPNFGEMTPEEYERWSGNIWYTYWGLEPGKDYDPENPPILPETLTSIPAQWEDVAVIPSATETDPDTQLVDTQLVVVVPREFRVSSVDTEIGTLEA